MMTLSSGKSVLVVNWHPLESHDNPQGRERPDSQHAEAFFQRMVYRLQTGWVHGYGFDRRYRYMTRLVKEYIAYVKTGNKEHLINVANYAYLEFHNPEHPNAHYNPGVESVSRHPQYTDNGNGHR